MIRALRFLAGAARVVAPAFFVFCLSIFALWFLLLSLHALMLLLGFAVPILLPWGLGWALLRHRRRRRPIPYHPPAGAQALTVAARTVR